MSEQLERLIQMANDIAINLSAGRSSDQAAAEISTHIRKFWAPPMREEIIKVLPEIKQQLHPNALTALETLD